MKINALIKVGSHLHKSWTNANFVRHDWFDAHWVRQKGGQYTAEDLSTRAFDMLTKHPCVYFEILSDIKKAPIEISIPVDGPDTEESIIAELEALVTEENPVQRRGRPKKAG